jgi:hypothetical protein
VNAGRAGEILLNWPWVKTTITSSPQAHRTAGGRPPRELTSLPVGSACYVSTLVEEARLVGWQRVESLTAIMDAANARLSALEDEVELESLTTSPVGPK